MNSGPGDTSTGPGTVWPGKRGLLCIGATALLLCLVLAGLRLLPAEPLRTGIPSSCLVRAVDGSMLRLTLSRDGQYRLWTPLEEIAEATVAALLLKEDRSFYWHPGVNPLSLTRAVWVTYGRG